MRVVDRCETSARGPAATAPNVLAARVLHDTRVAIELADGRTGTFDGSGFLAYFAFASLMRPAYFRLVFVAYGTICWPEREDFSPKMVAARLNAADDG